MKKTLILLGIFFYFLHAHSQNVGIGTSSPNALLDVSATNGGILIPRVVLTATNNASPLTSPTTSTLVYNTASASSGAIAVSPGFYYWNGSAWVRVIDNSSLSGATTVSNTSSANTLSTTVNGVTGSTVPLVNSLSNTSSANTLSTTVNGVTGTSVPIINSNTLSLSGNNLTATINGIGSSAQSLIGLSLSGDVTGTLASSTVGRIQGTGVAISSLIGNNLLQYNGTNWVNVTPASVLSAATTDTLSLSGNTLTSKVNGVAATSSAVSGVSNTSSANTLSTTINGVTGSTVPIINSHTLGLSGTSITDTINGVGSNALNLSSLDNNIYNSDGTLTGTRTVTMGGNTLNFTGGNIGIGTASPVTLFSNTTINTSGSDGNGISSASIAWANNAGGYTEALYNASSAANAEGLAVKMAATGTTNRLLDLSTGASQGSAGAQVMVVRADGKVGIGAGTPAASAALDISSTTGGLLLPRMNTVQQNAISSPAAGLVIFNTDCNILTYYNGSQWMQVGGVSPTALAATTNTATSFTANWNSMPDAASYYLDVSTVSNFTSFVSGYNNLNVGNITSYSIIGLSACSYYYYRVRAAVTCGVSGNSNVILMQTLCSSCKTLLASKPSLQNVNGTYNIQPGASPVSCYCDMTTSGGGWTELNSSLTSISAGAATGLAWSGNGTISGNNAGSTTCGSLTEYTLSTPAVGFSSVYALLTRYATVMQCSSITGQSATGYYTSSPFTGTYTSNATCNWSQPWAPVTCCGTGTQNNWVFWGTASNVALVYTNACAGTTADNGSFAMQWFVR